MRRLGLWERLPADELAPLREAVVYNGSDPRPLHFDAQGSGEDELGHLVANHVIRRVSWAAVQGREAIEVRAGDARARPERRRPTRATVRCRAADGSESTLRAPLVVAADSRFSEARRQAGIGAQMRDFGRSVIVCRMAHSEPNQAPSRRSASTSATRWRCCR